MFTIQLRQEVIVEYMYFNIQQHQAHPADNWQSKELLKTVSTALIQMAMGPLMSIVNLIPIGVMGLLYPDGPFFKDDWMILLIFTGLQKVYTRFL